MFFSAVLAGYFAWRTVRSSPEADINNLSDDSPNEKTSLKDKDESNFTRVYILIYSLLLVLLLCFVPFFFLFFSLSLLMLWFLSNCRAFKMVSGYLSTWPVGDTYGGISGRLRNTRILIIKPCEFLCKLCSGI